VNTCNRFSTEGDVLAIIVVLVLAVGGLLLWRAAPARPVDAAGAGASRGTRSRVRRRKISRDAAVRRSPIPTSRAPGPLCERAFGFFSRHADGQALRRARTLALAPFPARSSPARCWAARPVSSLT